MQRTSGLSLYPAFFRRSAVTSETSTIFPIRSQMDLLVSRIWKKLNCAFMLYRIQLRRSKTFNESTPYAANVSLKSISSGVIPKSCARQASNDSFTRCSTASGVSRSSVALSYLPVSETSVHRWHFREIDKPGRLQLCCLPWSVLESDKREESTHLPYTARCMYRSTGPLQLQITVNRVGMSTAVRRSSLNRPSCGSRG